VVDESQLLTAEEVAPEEEARFSFNEEQHLMLEDAKKIKAEAAVGDELVFPLETKEDYGRIAAQTAKQVIIQRLREAERHSILGEYSNRAGQIVSGKVQKIERGNVLVDLGRVTGLVAREDQIPGEYYRQGERIKCLLVSVEDTPRGVNLRLSRAHPKFVERLFEVEVPELAAGNVLIKTIAREAGGRTKLAVASLDDNIDPVGACVGQRGVRVNTVLAELGGEKIDIIEWSEAPANFISHALAPAKIQNVILDEDTRTATVEVEPDQFSLAVGRGGQNARLAARLSGWKIDIRAPGAEKEKVLESEE
jgi:N utilization substance protein A